MALFVDMVHIKCKPGNGGNGCVSFHREKYVMAGGPDGGDGGRGGDIVFMATERMHTLMDFRFNRRFEAANGSDGMTRRRKGKSGDPLVILVPVGTVVRDQASGRVILDMREADVHRVLKRGGNGGFGNARFATPTRQAPNFAKPGEKVDEVALTLELKSIADAGLVGFPNVGKSTILSVVTAARPKIANYHFTTLTPNLGIVRQHGDGFVLADIPGLVEGASDGVGLGHEFLRHIERTRLIIHVLDISGSEGRDPLEDYDVICAELERYGDLARRPVLVAANKLDLPDAEAHIERLKKKLDGTGIPIYPVSAATGAGLKDLMRSAAALLADLPPAEPFLEEELIEPDADAPFTVALKDGIYEVAGASISRLINSVNFSDPDSLNWFHRTLRHRGIIDALREAGAQEGDTVAMDDMEFDFME